MPDIHLLPNSDRNGREDFKKQSFASAPAYHIPDPEEKEKETAIPSNNKDRWKIPEEGMPDNKMQSNNGNGMQNVDIRQSMDIKKPLPKVKNIKFNKSYGFFGGLFGKKKSHLDAEPKQTNKPGQVFQLQTPKPKSKGFFSGLLKSKKSSIPARDAVPAYGREYALAAKKYKIDKVNFTSTVKNEEVGKITQPVSVIISPEIKLPQVLRPMAEDGVDVNLLPEGANLLPNKKLTTYFILAALLGIFILAVVYFGLIFYGRTVAQQNQEIDEQLQLVESSLKKYQDKEKEAATLSYSIEAVQAVLERHIYWSKFFSQLEKVTLADVYYQSVGIADNGLVNLSGSADSFTTVARQYLVFQENSDIFPEFVISSISGSEEVVNFNVALTLAPSVYYSLEENQ